MSTIINGCTLTRSEVVALGLLTNYMLAAAGDSWASNTTSPKGDGRAIPLLEIFPRGNQGTAHRRAVHRLQKMGVLRVCEFEIDDCDRVAFKPILPPQTPRNAQNRTVNT